MRSFPLSRSHRRCLRVEGLEVRDVPAGSVTVSVSGTVLTLTGDDQSNLVVMSRAATGQVIVDNTGTAIVAANPASGTVVAGVFTSTSTGITSVKAVMKGGNDYIGTGTFTADFSFTGGFDYDAGDGVNTLNLDGSSPGSKKILLGSLTFKSLDGQDGVIVDSTGTPGSEIGAVKISTGDGAAAATDIKLTNVKVKSVTLTAGEGGESIYLNSVSGIGGVPPLVKATGGDGITYLSFTDSILGAVDLKSTGDAFVLLDDATSALPATSTGNVSLTGGGFGLAFFNTSGTAVNTGAVSVKAGREAQAYTNAGTTSTGAMKIAGNTLRVELRGKVSSLSATGGSGADRVTSYSSSTSGDVAITTGSGEDAINLGGTMDKLTITSGAGADTINLNGAQVKKAATIKTEGGADVLSILAGTTFFETFGIDQGAGDDTLSITSSGTAVTFTGKVTAKQGLGNDTLTMDLAGATPPVFTVVGNVIDGGLGFDNNGANVNAGISSNPNLSFANYEL